MAPDLEISDENYEELRKVQEAMGLPNIEEALRVALAALRGSRSR